MQVRMLSDLVSDPRPPVPGLPHNLYSAEWVHNRHPDYIEKLNMNEYKYTLPAIDRFAPRR
jgi:hypothetical protein